jgi:hypothetical protein
VVAEGTPLARLQSVHEDPDSGVLAGDINDVLAQCDQKDEVVAKLTRTVGKQKKWERVPLDSNDVKHLTAMLVQAG